MGISVALTFWGYSRRSRKEKTAPASRGWRPDHPLSPGKSCTLPPDPPGIQRDTLM